MRQGVRIVGVGNPYRGDDGVGPYVLAGLAHALPEANLIISDGEVSGLLTVFESCSELILVDAMDGSATGVPAGTLVHLDGNDEALAESGLRTSTHAMGVAQAIALARSLNSLPEMLTVTAIAGESFSPGEGLSAAVGLAADRLIQQLIEQYAHA